MERVFFKSDTLVSVATTPDGKIDYRELGRAFGLEPYSIRLCGDLFPKNDDLLTRDSWTDIKNCLGVAGTNEDPVMVSGRPISEAPTGLEGEMQIDLGIGTLVNLDHPLSKFVACLRDSTLQERILNAKSKSVIELPEGIVWLGDEDNFSNQLFMRPCYFDLLEAKEEYFKLNSSLRAVVYTGTPGIGKSHSV